MAFEQLRKALLQLKQNRLKEEEAETQRRNAITAATTQFALIKSEVVAPIFDKAAALLTEEGLFAEITDQENETTRSISLKVDLSTDNEPGPQGSLICRLDEDMQTCRFGKAIAQSTEPMFDGKPYHLKEVTEEITYRITEQFLIDLITSIKTKSLSS
jgi:hypothetical protein